MCCLHEFVCVRIEEIPSAQHSHCFVEPYLFRCFPITFVLARLNQCHEPGLVSAGKLCTGSVSTFIHLFTALGHDDDVDSTAFAAVSPFTVSTVAAGAVRDWTELKPTRQGQQYFTKRESMEIHNFFRRILPTSRLSYEYKQEGENAAQTT